MKFKEIFTTNEVFITRRVNEGKEYLTSKFPDYKIEYINSYDYDLSKDKVVKEKFPMSDSNKMLDIIYVVDKKKKKVFYDTP